MKKNFIATNLASGNAKRRTLKNLGLTFTGSISEVEDRINSLTFKQLKQGTSLV